MQIRYRNFYWHMIHSWRLCHSGSRYFWFRFSFAVIRFHLHGQIFVSFFRSIFSPLITNHNFSEQKFAFSCRPPMVMVKLSIVDVYFWEFSRIISVFQRFLALESFLYWVLVHILTYFYWILVEFHGQKTGSDAPNEFPNQNPAKWPDNFPK